MATQPRLVREGVEAAQAVDRQAEGEGERPPGDDAHPQSGEGSGTDPDDDPRDVGGAGARLGERRVEFGARCSACARASRVVASATTAARRAGRR